MGRRAAVVWRPLRSVSGRRSRGRAKPGFCFNVLPGRCHVLASWTGPGGAAPRSSRPKVDWLAVAHTSADMCRLAGWGVARGLAAAASLLRPCLAANMVPRAPRVQRHHMGLGGGVRVGRRHGVHAWRSTGHGDHAHQLQVRLLDGGEGAVRFLDRTDPPTTVVDADLVPAMPAHVMYEGRLLDERLLLVTMIPSVDQVLGLAAVKPDHCC